MVPKWQTFPSGAGGTHSYEGGRVRLQNMVDMGWTVDWAKKGCAGGIVAGCCLMVACSGACQWPGHGVVIRDDRSLALNRAPWSTSPADADRACSVAAIPALAAQDCEHPRFHPVPTQPVFLPRIERCMGIGENADWHGMDATDFAREPTQRAPSPPTVEVIPTPHPEVDEGWKAMSFRHEAARSVGPGGNLSPSPDLNAIPIPPKLSILTDLRESR